MFKRLLGLFAAICILFTAVQGSVFALDEDREIEAAKKAIKDKKDTLTLVNDMTPESFLYDIKLILPEGSTVELSFSKESDYRIYNATSEKDGSIFANICFTCGPYTRHEMYDFKIPALSGASAEANADKENLAKDIAAARAVFKNISLDPNVTAEDIRKMAQAAVTNGSTVEVTGEFTKVDSTETKKGSAKCFLKFTLNKETDTLKVYNTLRLLDASAENKTKTDEGKNGIKFNDVAANAYYYQPVLWAVEKGITAGTSDTSFSPDQTCTRAQILTFLWRAVGSPKAEAANPFADITTQDYYYDAAIWAYGKGMVSGRQFNGSTPCTRASTVMYLWKNADSPEYGDLGAFDDVDSNAEYCEAVSWAVMNDVTSGVSETEFAPEAICSRAQIVTFLQRAIAE